MHNSIKALMIVFAALTVTGLSAKANDHKVRSLQIAGSLSPLLALVDSVGTSYPKAEFHFLPVSATSAFSSNRNEHETTAFGMFGLGLVALIGFISLRSRRSGRNA
jgi:hypothetical protein